ncbi:MAG: Cof-type HAD-IIB family hydrolase [Candidatus Onthomonas sp.]
MEGKMLFLDLDGTLLNDRKEITPGNRLAINEALARGHRVVITTGRPLKSAILQAEKLGMTGKGCYLIAFNGGILYDCFRREQLCHQALSIETACRVVAEANRRGLHVQTYDDRDVLVEPRCDNESVRRYCSLINMDFRVIRDVRQDLVQDPAKCLIIDYQNQKPLLEIQEWLQTNMAGQADCFFSCDQYLEVVPVGTGKGAAVVDLCQLLNVPIRNAVAVGDAANDLTMIQAAGTGVAMANGTDEVKAVADYVTQRDNNHDGIAEVIARCLG